MSTQWEVVTKSKKSKNIIEKKLGYVERKKIIDSGPKLEEILPSHQIKSILSNVNKDKNKEKKKVQQSNKNSTSTPRKSKPVEKTDKAKSQNPPQPPKPKNLEAALNAIQPADLENLLENLKVSYPGSELLWLKGVASFLNNNLHYETDPIFAGKSIQYPSVVVPKALKAVIISLFDSVEEVTLFYFFDQMLTGVAMDMSKNQHSLGNKILLQLVAQVRPQVCCNNLAKNAILKNSYQNRSTIGLSLLWALGQGGYKDLTVGIKVWQNIMLSLIELKSYSRFVCSYIEKILTSADNNDSKLILTQDEFLATYNALKASYNSLHKDCQQMLNESSGLFVKKYIENAPKLQNLFSIFFRNIDSFTNSQLDVSACVYALIKSTDCFKIWKMNYKKNIFPSCALFNKILYDWENLPNTFTGSFEFKNFLTDAALLNVELGRKKDPNIPHLIDMVKNLQDKSSQKKKTQTKGSSSIFPWIFGIFLLLGAIGALISYDVHLHDGVFEKSSTGKLLKDTGALPYVEVAWYKTMSCSARGYKWAEENVPVYYETVTVFVKPYTNLARDLFKIACNGFTNLWETTKDFAETKTPVVVELVEKYVPGLPKKIQDISISAWSTSVSAYQNGCDFFKTKVFVGTLSPENLSKALNDTQIAAAKYYSWFHEKVDAYAKIK